MRHTLIVLIIFCCHFNLFSQTHRQSLTILFGPSFSLGDFKSTALDNELAGNAKTGISGEVSYRRSLKNNFGWEIMLYGKRNPVNVKALGRHLSVLAPGPVPTPVTGGTHLFR